jgi:CRP-like cAMP-binding protein
LGLTLETVSRVFAKLKHVGTLQVTNRFIRVLEPEALRRAAAGLS